MDEKLKPCPFCGGKYIEIKDNAVFNHAQYGCSPADLPFYAFCNTCGARSDVCSDKQTVLEIWNRRTE